jgi:hypothetical protein
MTYQVPWTLSFNETFHLGEKLSPAAKILDCHLKFGLSVVG